MTDATPAPETVAAPAEVTATPVADTTTEAVATPAASDTDAAKSAEASASAQPGGETADDDAPAVTALSKEERRQFSAFLKALPPEHQKAFNKILDGKNQTAATERKRADELAQVKALVDQIGQDPEAAIKALSERFVKAKAETTTAPAKQAKQTVSPEEVQAVEDMLPDESKPLAKVLAPVVKAMMGRQLEPVFADLESRQKQARVDEATRELEAFEKDHPDWKEFEPQMVDWGKKIPRADDLSMRDYTEALYVLASAGPKQAAATKAGVEKVLEKVAKAAANAEPDTSSVSPARVVRKPAANIHEAYAMALRGEEVEV